MIINGFHVIVFLMLQGHCVSNCSGKEKNYTVIQQHSYKDNDILWLTLYYN